MSEFCLSQNFFMCQHNLEFFFFFEHEKFTITFSVKNPWSDHPIEVTYYRTPFFMSIIGFIPLYKELIVSMD